MLGILENVAISTALQWVFSGYLSFWGAVWSWAWTHPLTALAGGFAGFGVTFMAYGTLRRMWDDGSFAALNKYQKGVILFVAFAPPLCPFVHAYLFDIFVMRCLVGTILFRVAPWYQDWRAWSASWTFSRLISLFEFDPGWRGPRARFWRPILHAIDPKGH